MNRLLLISLLFFHSCATLNKSKLNEDRTFINTGYILIPKYDTLTLEMQLLTQDALFTRDTILKKEQILYNGIYTIGDFTKIVLFNDTIDNKLPIHYYLYNCTSDSNKVIISNTNSDYFWLRATVKYETFQYKPLRSLYELGIHTLHLDPSLYRSRFKVCMYNVKYIQLTRIMQ